MDLDAEIASCWSEHDRDPAGVRTRLEAIVPEADERSAGRLPALINHVVGSTLSDWPCAVRLIRACASKLPADPVRAGALAHLAVALFLGGGELGAAMAAELEATMLSAEPPLATFLRVRLLMAEALLAAGQQQQARTLFAAAMDISPELSAPTSADRSIAVAANNFSSALLEGPERSPEDLNLALRGAEVARRFWLRAGDWRNHERADYLLALVHNALGQHQSALEVAERGLDTIQANGEEAVDRAFLQLSRAVAFRGLGRDEEYRRGKGEVEAFLSTVDDPELAAWLSRELERASGG